MLADSVTAGCSVSSVVALLTALLIGLAVGLGAYTFIYAKGYSYLTNNPAACANCHVIQAQYDAWMKSSHHSVAACNDCHTPHNLIGKYAVKANNVQSDTNAEPIVLQRVRRLFVSSSSWKGSLAESRRRYLEHLAAQ